MRVLLWQVRSSLGLSLTDVERLTGVPRSTLHRIENGAVSPRLAVLEEIAKGLGVSIADLYDSPYS